ncbi:glutamyl-tRNA reductase [Actinoalloteichus sp. GBA129-24]|uniref:Glutamyl-tRNA reductase n=1 Tax=Actinoalloteichus fjordicus TaxID=1612552 RepID=A0AAC9L831_9PSEU|nr:glutamyl-tRNA reductase [Actinoalloteichus fjordicus]APU18504.1 glutamyl-tRNA reductase [Actinoalloteichus sp. GBA129-24]
MSLLAIGMSHRSASLTLLERAVVAAPDTEKLLDELLRCPSVNEVLLLSTCNRVEVYAVVESFHSAVEEVTGVMARHSGVDGTELTDGMYVHYAAAAVEHLFTVAAGLDSMVVGEEQILGQLRGAYTTAESARTVGRALHEVLQQALRVGKRAHTETEIGAEGASVVSEALSDAAALLGALTGRRGLVVGAGSMGGLAAAHLRRAGIAELVIANRTADNGARLAATTVEAGTPARSVGLDRLSVELAEADVVVVCTGSLETVVDVDTVRAALARRANGLPLVFCDLGLPRDVDAGVAELESVSVVDLDTLRDRLRGRGDADAFAKVGALIAAEVEHYFAAQRSASVTPTVTALRRQAAEVVDAELLRLDSRLPDLAPDVRAELSRTVRRVVDKLLHTPTVRVKQLAAGAQGVGYADALRELFNLDQQLPNAVSAAKTGHPEDARTARDGVSRVESADVGGSDGRAVAGLSDGRAVAGPRDGRAAANPSGSSAASSSVLPEVRSVADAPTTAVLTEVANVPTATVAGTTQTGVVGGTEVVSALDSTPDAPGSDEVTESSRASAADEQRRRGESSSAERHPQERPDVDGEQR